MKSEKMPMNCQIFLATQIIFDTFIVFYLANILGGLENSGTLVMMNR